MSISTYAELLTAMDNWLDHGLFSAREPEFIALFEAFINRKLLTREMETSASLTPSSGSASLPSDYIQWRRVTWEGSIRQELEYVNPSWLAANYPSSQSDRPSVFTIEGSTLKLRPIDSTSVTLDYYQKIPALTVSNTTNWLLAAYPDLYLFGSLTEADAFGNNDPRASMWKSRRDEIIAEIIQLNAKNKGVGGMRIMGPTP